MIATGTYKPRMKVFDLEELSMKTERVTDSENVDFCVSPHSILLCRRADDLPDDRCYRLIGQRLSICSRIGLSSCTRSPRRTTGFECPDMDVH